MNIGEANDVQVLVAWIATRNGDRASVLSAAGRLADRSRRTLGAGMDAVDMVHELTVTGLLVETGYAPGVVPSQASRARRRAVELLLDCHDAETVDAACEAIRALSAVEAPATRGTPEFLESARLALVALRHAVDVMSGRPVVRDYPVTAKAVDAACGHMAAGAAGLADAAEMTGNA